jgi:hypothetical protein
MTQDSSVGKRINKNYRLCGHIFVPVTVRDISLCHHSCTGSEIYLTVTTAVCPGVKWPECEHYCSSTTSVEVESM